MLHVAVVDMAAIAFPTKLLWASIEYKFKKSKWIWMTCICGEVNILNMDLIPSRWLNKGNQHNY